MSRANELLEMFQEIEEISDKTKSRLKKAGAVVGAVAGAVALRKVHKSGNLNVAGVRKGAAAVGSAARKAGASAKKAGGNFKSAADRGMKRAGSAARAAGRTVKSTVTRKHVPGTSMVRT